MDIKFVCGLVLRVVFFFFFVNTSFFGEIRSIDFSPLTRETGNPCRAESGVFMVDVSCTGNV